MIGRERCNHNLRIRIPGKSSICLICHCNKLEDSLGFKHSAAMIGDIIHQIRLMNSVLDAVDEKNAETQLTPVLRTCKALLQIHNDEVGTVVSQALEKIRSKLTRSMFEDFLQTLTTQILESITLGNLESLTVLIQRKEILSSFRKNYGHFVLSKLVQVLEQHVANVIKCPVGSAAGETNRLAMDESENFSNSTTFETPSSGAIFSRRKSLKIVEKLFDVLEANCPNDTDAILIVTDNRDGSSLSEHVSSADSQQVSILCQDPKGIIMSCTKLLSSQIVDMRLLSVKILIFLGKLLRSPEVLGMLFSDSTGTSVCSMLKKLFNLQSQSEEVKMAALGLTHQILQTYKQGMEDMGSHKTSLANLPSVILHVDLIHFIKLAMNTDSENLLSVAVQVLDEIVSIPMFTKQGRSVAVPVLETTLQISTLRIPDNISSWSTYRALNRLIHNISNSLVHLPPKSQRQLLFLFGNLPKNWTAVQFLPWIKLLLACTDAQLQESLWSFFLAFVQRDSSSAGNHCCVAPLKCVLLIAHALLKCQSTQTVKMGNDPVQIVESGKAAVEKQILNYVMDPRFLPAIMTLLQYGISDDSVYVITLLELVKSCTPQWKLLQSHESAGILDKFSVTFESETDDDTNAIGQEKEDPTYTVEVDRKAIIKVDETFRWSANLFLRILGITRLNAEFVTSKRLFDLWNENIAKILAETHSLYLPQFEAILMPPDCSFSTDSIQSGINGIASAATSTKTLEERIRYILEKLDIDACGWSKIIKSSEASINEMDTLEKQQHDVILAFYSCYGFYAGKDLSHFIDGGFVDRYSSFLDDTIENHEIQKTCFDWERLGFYFRVALMIASALPHETVAPFPETFEKLLLYTRVNGSKFAEDVMVFHSAVFSFLLKWNIYQEYVRLVETWLQQDREACLGFYTSGDTHDDKLKTEITNSLITLAAEGDKETSELAVKLGGIRLKRFKCTFDLVCVKSNIHQLVRKIPTNDENLHPDTLLRLSNVICLAIKDDYLFCEENRFSVGFLDEIIKIMMKFHDVSKIGKRCLKLLLKVISNEATFQSVNTYLVGHQDFLRFLGSKLTVGKATSSDEIDTALRAHKLMAALITKNWKHLGYTVSASISWKLSSVLGYIQLIPRIEILDFLIAIFKVNFRCPLIEVEELDLEETGAFAKVLLNLFINLQALTHKICFRTISEAVWELKCEFLRIATEKREIVKHPTFQTDVLFQPWIKVALTHLLVQCKHVPSQAPLKALEFIHRWTRMISFHILENSEERNFLQQSFIIQSHSIFFKTLLDNIKKDPTQAPALENSKNDSTQKKLMKESAPKPQSPSVSRCTSSFIGVNLFDISQKGQLISKIAHTCDKFLSSCSKD